MGGMAKGEENAWGKLVLSAASAATAETATYPLDFLKTRLQIDQGRSPLGILPTAARIIRQEGPLTIYAGLPAAVLRHIPYTSIRTSTFENLRNWAQTRHGQTEPSDVPLFWLLGFGMLSGGLGQAAAVPADLIKVRLQGNTRQYNGIIDAFGKIVRQEGILGLWRGGLPAIQRAALVNLGELTTYDTAKRQIVKSRITGGDNLGAHVLSSMCSGIVSAAVSTPADVVKTRLMSQDPNSPHFRGMLDCFRKTAAAEGFRGLYKGFLPTWARLGPWQLTFWVTFEQLRQLQGIKSW